MESCVGITSVFWLDHLILYSSYNLWYSLKELQVSIYSKIFFLCLGTESVVITTGLQFIACYNIPVPTYKCCFFFFLLVCMIRDTIDTVFSPALLTGFVH